MKNNKILHCQDSSNKKKTKYHTVRTVPTSMKNNKIGCWNWPDSVVFCCFSIGFWNCPDSGILLFLMDVGTVLTVWYMKNNKILHCQDSSNKKKTKYHTVRTVPTSMENNKIPHCQNSSNRKTTKYHT
jgi:hypothetical protein